MSAASNTLLLLGGAILQKIVAFGFNQLTLAFTTPEVIGKASIQLELWLATCLFVSREAIRITCLRTPLKGPGAVPLYQFINLSWIPVIAVVVISAGMLAFVHQSQDSASFISFALYSAAAALECAVEPLYNLYNNSAFVAPRVRAETLALLLKSSVTYIAVARFQIGIVGFGLSQLAYSAAYVATMISYFPVFSAQQRDVLGIISFPDILPTMITKNLSLNSLFHPDLIGSTMGLFTSSITKHCLTEADRITLTLTCSDRDQGVFAVSNNYGSLLARVVYLPLEDAARLAFASKDAGETVHTTRASLLHMLKVVTILGAVISVFGPSYVRILVLLAIRGQWDRDAVAFALVCYCYYLWPMGINGIMEACIQVKLPTKLYHWSSIGLVLSSSTFAVAALYFARDFGSSGVILANLCAVIVRLLWNSACLVQTALSDESEAKLSWSTVSRTLTLLWHIVPKSWWWVSLVVFKALLSVSEEAFLGSWKNSVAEIPLAWKFIAMHIAVGAVCGLSFLTLTFFTCSSAEVSFIKALIVRRKPATNEHTREKKDL